MLSTLQISGDKLHIALFIFSQHDHCSMYDNLCYICFIHSFYQIRISYVPILQAPIH